MVKFDGRQWERVQRTPQDPAEREAQAANTNILQSDMFISACKACEIEPTRRQASKYRRKKGLIYQFMGQ